MRLPIVPMIIWIVVNLGIGVWIFNILRKRHSALKIARYLWLALVVAVTAVALVAVTRPYRSGDDASLLKLNWMLFVVMTFTFPQIVYLVFDLLGRIPRLFGRKRCRWSSRTGIAAAYMVFIAMWWGALYNRFQIDINEITVEIEGLPESFDGYRIVQFSDLHTGTFGKDTGFVEKLVETINDQKADAVFFTGDIVNRRSRELVPFVEPLSKISAADGVVAILGNHDYGDYIQWYNRDAKMTNMEELTDMY
ncbi:MAG: metallophosphoesterase, partial [Muribaculaceae bacterium]|nr:metallophosphoesterase [Muribaculaceae bacterium]